MHPNGLQRTRKVVRQNIRKGGLAWADTTVPECAGPDRDAQIYPHQISRVARQAEQPFGDDVEVDLGGAAADRHGA